MGPLESNFFGSNLSFPCRRRDAAHLPVSSVEKVGGVQVQWLCRLDHLPCTPRTSALNSVWKSKFLRKFPYADAQNYDSKTAKAAPIKFEYRKKVGTQLAQALLKTRARLQQHTVELGRQQTEMKEWQVALQRKTAAKKEMLQQEHASLLRRGQHHELQPQRGFQPLWNREDYLGSSTTTTGTGKRPKAKGSGKRFVMEVQQLEAAVAHIKRRLHHLQLGCEKIEAEIRASEREGYWLGRKVAKFPAGLRHSAAAIASKSSGQSTKSFSQSVSVS